MLCEASKTVVPCRRQNASSRPRAPSPRCRDRARRSALSSSSTSGSFSSDFASATRVFCPAELAVRPVEKLGEVEIGGERRDPRRHVLDAVKLGEHGDSAAR